MPRLLPAALVPLALRAVLLAFHFLRSAPDHSPQAGAHDSSEEAAGRVMVLAEVFLASSSRNMRAKIKTHSEQNGSVFGLLFRA